MTRSKGDLDHLRTQAIALRRAGKSRTQIKRELGIANDKLLTRLLQGEPPQEWTRRPNAKDDLRDQARELRKQGLKYKDIAAKLHVSMSSVSLWVRDLPIPPRYLPEASRQRSIEGSRRWHDEQRAIRADERQSEVAAAAAEVGELTDREVLIAGAVAYWCEGTKRKRPGDNERVVFINSDPGLVVFFLRFLDAAGISRNDLIFHVHIHETADVELAERFWRDVTDAQPDQFGKTNLKKHNPKTARKNTGDDYHGCLRIEVRRSSKFYWKIEGWASAAMSAA